MNNVAVITGYVPLDVKHMNESEFHRLGMQLIAACQAAEVPCYVFNHFPYEKCWLAQEKPPMVGANPRAHDRFDTDEQHAKNNVVCNQFIEWAWEVYKDNPKLDVVVMMTYTVTKQGGFTNNQVQPRHITQFLERVKQYKFNDIPVPGISESRVVNTFGHNWRFCGSTHLWPTRWLKEIRHEYKKQVRSFIKAHNKTPLDLAIWPAVENNTDLPYRWYKAEYDATQFTNFEPPQEGPR